MKTSGSKTGGIVVIIIGAFITTMILIYSIYDVICMLVATDSA